MQDCMSRQMAVDCQHDNEWPKTRKIHNMKTSSFTAVLEKEGTEYVALCPELDVASQGETIELAMANLREAVELFLECASPDEVKQRLHNEVFVTRFEAAYA